MLVLRLGGRARRGARRRDDPRCGRRRDERGLPASRAGCRLGGFEFACAIPGTAGGGVWMNAGAYGSDWSAILVRALVATADGTGWLTPAELGLSYRHSNLRHGQVVAAVEYRLTPREPARSAPRCSDLVDRRKATQPTTKRTFGSVFKNPPGEVGAGTMLEHCGLKGYRRGGAVISPKHANFIENAGGATHRRLSRPDGRGAPPRARGIRRRARARGRAARRDRRRPTETRRQPKERAARTANTAE